MLGPYTCTDDGTPTRFLRALAFRTLAQYQYQVPQHLHTKQLLAKLKGKAPTWCDRHFAYCIPTVADIEADL